MTTPPPSAGSHNSSPPSDNDHAPGPTPGHGHGHLTNAEPPVLPESELAAAGFCLPCWENYGEVHRPLPMAYALAVERITGGKVPAYVCPLVEGVWHIEAGVAARVVMAMQERFAGKRP